MAFTRREEGLLFLLLFLKASFSVVEDGMSLTPLDRDGLEADTGEVEGVVI